MKHTLVHRLLLSAAMVALLLGSLSASAQGPETRKPATLRPAPAPALPASPPELAPESSFIYDDEPATPIAINNLTACYGNEIERTFAVSDSFTVVGVQVGFNAAHTYRGDLRAWLRSPAGTQVALVNATNSNSWDNYDLLLSDASTNPLDDGDDDDTAAPYYDRDARPRQSLSAFDGESSAGVWTLLLCDAFPSDDDGAYNRGRLVLESPPGGPALRASNTADRIVAAQDMEIAYQVAVRNVGLADASNTTLTNAIPAGTAFVTGSLSTQGNPPATFDGSAVTWSGTVAGGQSIVVTYRVQVERVAGFVTNTAVVAHASLPEPVQASASSQVFAGQGRLFSGEANSLIPDDECTTSVEAPIAVNESFPVSSVRVGINLDHTYRGDITALLRSPAGTEAEIIPSTADSYLNYDVLLDSASADPLNDGSDDDIELPFYERSAEPITDLAAFAGENAAGVWTLSVCDDYPLDDGTLRHWSLFFGYCYLADVHPNADHSLPGLCDGDVDVADVQRVAGCWQQSIGPACPASLDLTGDGVIDTLDLAAVAGKWGWPDR